MRDPESCTSIYVVHGFFVFRISLLTLFSRLFLSTFNSSQCQSPTSLDVVSTLVNLSLSFLLLNLGLSTPFLVKVHTRYGDSVPVEEFCRSSYTDLAVPVPHIFLYNLLSWFLHPTPVHHFSGALILSLRLSITFTVFPKLLPILY